MNTISVLTKIPNLLNELKIKLPNLVFHEVISPENDSNFKNSKIIVGDFNLLGPYINTLENTKWVQGTWAGVDLLLSHIKKPPPFIITRFSGQHFATMMSEYVVTHIVNRERNLYKVHENQMNKCWSRKDNIMYYRTISDLTVGIMGVGTIGNKIGNMLYNFGAKVIGLGRRPKIEASSENKYLKQYFINSKLPEFLQNCDYVVNVLPNTSDTIGFLNNNVLKNCAEKKAVFINIGRGTIIDEAELIKALNENWLSAAIIDVFAVEPLPESSPLWLHPKVHITPHVAGVSRPKDFAEQFSENLKLFNENKPIPATVDVVKGY